MARSHRTCGFCKSVVPIAETECPFCGESLENYGAFGRQLEDLLPKERPATTVLAGLTIAVYAMVSLLAGGTSFVSPSSYTLIHFGAMFPPYILEGQWWRFMTAVFLHGGVLHIGFNLYALWLLGPLIENSFGKLRFLIIFVVSGLLASLLSFGWGFAGVELGQMLGVDWFAGSSFARSSVGMSGAVTGLIGVGVSAGHRVKTAQGTQIRNVMLRWMMFILVFGIVVPQVDNAAHIGGFLAGLGLGAVLPLKDRASKKAGYVYATAAALCALMIVGSLAAQVIATPKDYPADLDLYPTGIFGIELRERNTSNRALTGAGQACEDAVAAAELITEDTPERRAQIEMAMVNCDEFVYLLPVVGEGYLYSAYAHGLAGDLDFGCKRLGTAQLFRRFDITGSGSSAFDQKMVHVQTVMNCP